MPIEVREIPIRIRVNNPPPATYEGKPAEFGLQDKAGNLTPGQLTPDGVLVFEFALKVSVDNPPNFTGSYAQERFIYLSYRPVGGTAWIKRIKVMLGGITAAQVAKGETLETTVDGRRAARVDTVWK
jgi:hypothetical protein